MSRPALDERLRFLLTVVQREAILLSDTDARLFAEPMDVARVAACAADPVLSERVDAFVARFGRLQDTLGDKLLPALLNWLGEPGGPAIDNLGKAERFGWIESADVWMRLRRLRNQMIHEYVEDPSLFADALCAAHEGIGGLLVAVQRMRAEAGVR
ncbi:MAG: hypothetical protein IPG57_22250 [Burkholderiales bacterium]|nr:hypothetical protein [Burkholderiales bacterium]